MDMAELKTKNAYYERIIGEKEKEYLIRLIEKIEIPTIGYLRGNEEFKTSVFILQTFEIWKQDSIDLLNKI